MASCWKRVERIADVTRVGGERDGEEDREEEGGQRQSELLEEIVVDWEIGRRMTESDERQLFLCGLNEPM